MKIYIACHDPELAREMRAEAVTRGYEVTSRWLDMPFNPTSEHTPPERSEIASIDHDDVLTADALILIAGPDRYPGGKFVEAGIAIGSGKRVFVFGRRENMLLWHPSVSQHESIEDLFHAIEHAGVLSGGRG